MDVSKRLKWVRKTLCLKKSHVADACNIPRSTYFNREYDLRASNPKEFILLSQFFNPLWQQRFSGSNKWLFWENGNYPIFDGEAVKEISPLWLMIGKDTTSDFYKKLLEEMWSDLKQRELEYLQRIRDIESINN